MLCLFTPHPSSQLYVMYKVGFSNSPEGVSTSYTQRTVRLLFF